MTSLKSLKEKAKNLNKKLDKKNPYPPMGFFTYAQREEMEAFRKKYPKAYIMFGGGEDLLD